MLIEYEYLGRKKLTIRFKVQGPIMPMFQTIKQGEIKVQSCSLKANDYMNFNFSKLVLINGIK